LGYANQTAISLERVDLATVCTIHYGLHVGMVIRYIKGAYVSESRDADAILKVVSPYIKDEDCNHIKCIINQGCPPYLDFEEDYDNKQAVLCKGNQHTFLRHPDVTAKAMNKEEKTVTCSLSNTGLFISCQFAEQPLKEYEKNMASTG
jgi:hypothetical protein